MGEEELTEVGEIGDADRQVRDHVVLPGPHFTDIPPILPLEREARNPRRIEAGRADDDIDLVLLALMVHKPGLRNLANGVREDRRIRRDQRLQIPRRRRRPSTARVEVLRDNLVDQPRIALQMPLHLIEAELPRLVRLLTALDNELKPLVQLILDLLAVLQVLLRILLQILNLLLRVREVAAVLAGPGLCEAGRDPNGAAHPVVQLRDGFLDLGDDLHAAAAGAEDGDALVLQGVAFLVRGGVHQLAFEVLQAGDVRPLPVVEHAAGVDEELGLLVADGAGRQIFDFEAPQAGRVIPAHIFDLVAEFDVFVDEVVLVVDALEVLPDFRRVRVVVRPILDLPAELVVDAGNVARAAWIPDSTIISCQLCI